MKKYKIYIKDNYLFIEDVTKKEFFRGHKKDVFIDKNNLNKPIYRIFNVKDWNSTISLSVGQILKEDNTVYTSVDFDLFYQVNTGGSSNGGGGVDNTTLLTEIRDAVLANSLIEFDVTMPIPANSDVIYDITPVGSEIRDYQIFEVGSQQDITGQVSNLVVGTNQIRIFTIIALNINIVGTRTKV